MFKSLALIGLIFMSSACAPQAEDQGFYEPVDPIESVNRQVLNLNDQIDNYLITPIVNGYRYLPHKLRLGIRNALNNLNEPFSVANNLLQADFQGAGNGVARFFINSTYGIAGLVDVADSELNLRPDKEDIGQTLAVWGLGEGPYLMLPIFGPSNLRDATGFAGKIFLDPVNYAVDNDAFQVSRTVLTGADTREAFSKPIESLRKNSLDFYAAVRSAYHQIRVEQIKH